MSLAGNDPDEAADVWMAPGLALAGTGGPDALHEAIRCFDRAIALRRFETPGELRSAEARLEALR